MEKYPLTDDDQKLVDMAFKEAEEKFDKERHWVASVVRTQSGKTYQAMNLYAESAIFSLCAEPIAIGQAVDADRDDPIETIVTVYRRKRSDPPEIKIVPPCGRCREVIIDYGPDSFIVMREPGETELFKIRAVDLLPYRYEIFRKENKAS